MTNRVFLGELDKKLRLTKDGEHKDKDEDDENPQCKDNYDPIALKNLEAGKVIFIKAKDKEIYECVQIDGDAQLDALVRTLLEKKQDWNNVPLSEADMKKLRKMANIPDPPEIAYATTTNNATQLSTITETQFEDSVTITITWECADDIKEFNGTAVDPAINQEYSLRAHYVYPAKCFQYYQNEVEINIANREDENNPSGY